MALVSFDTALRIQQNSADFVRNLGNLVKLEGGSRDGDGILATLNLMGILHLVTRTGVWIYRIILGSAKYYGQPRPVSHPFQAWMELFLQNCLSLSSWGLTSPAGSLHFHYKKDLVLYTSCTITNNEWEQPPVSDSLRYGATGDVARERRWTSCHLEVTLSLQRCTLGSSVPSELSAHVLGVDKYTHFFQKSHFSNNIHLPLAIVPESPQIPPARGPTNFMWLFFPPLWYEGKNHRFLLA